MQIVKNLTHQGLGRIDGDDNLVPGVLPGEEIEIAADGKPRILTPSADRVRPPCRHAKSCGGCAMQHASDDFVAAWKQDIVQRALAARGIDAPFRALSTSPPQSRRRAKLSARRTKKGAIVGFHARMSDVLIEVPDCQLLSPNLMKAFDALSALTLLACSRKGEIALTVTDTANGPDVHVETAMPLTVANQVAATSLAHEFGLSRLSWNDETVVTLAPPQQPFGGVWVTPPPGAFLQATAHGENALQTAVLEITQGASRIIDLFAGCGTFALPLAKGAEVHAVEGDQPMLDALDRAWRTGQQLKRVTTECRDLFRRPLESDELNRFDAAVIDPPRAGAEAQIKTLAASQIDTIAMVSCNPVTFARDAATLIASGFTIDWAQMVDQFRWSSHVEAVAAFSRNRGVR